MTGGRVRDLVTGFWTALVALPGMYGPDLSFASSSALLFILKLIRRQNAGLASLISPSIGFVQSTTFFSGL